MDNTEKKLAALKKKQEQLKAQIQKLEAGEKSREKKRDTRRKILIGAYYLDKARAENGWDDLVQRMDGYLNRQTDRVLFDLPPLKQPTGDKQAAE